MVSVERWILKEAQWFFGTIGFSFHGYGFSFFVLSFFHWFCIGKVSGYQRHYDDYWISFASVNVNSSFTVSIYFSVSY